MMPDLIGPPDADLAARLAVEGEAIWPRLGEYRRKSLAGSAPETIGAGALPDTAASPGRRSKTGPANSSLDSAVSRTRAVADRVPVTGQEPPVFSSRPECPDIPAFLVRR